MKESFIKRLNTCYRSMRDLIDNLISDGTGITLKDKDENHNKVMSLLIDFRDLGLIERELSYVPSMSFTNSKMDSLFSLIESYCQISNNAEALVFLFNNFSLSYHDSNSALISINSIKNLSSKEALYESILKSFERKTEFLGLVDVPEAIFRYPSEKRSIELFSRAAEALCPIDIVNYQYSGPQRSLSLTDKNMMRNVDLSVLRLCHTLEFTLKSEDIEFLDEQINKLYPFIMSNLDVVSHNNKNDKFRSVLLSSISLLSQYEYHDIARSLYLHSRPYSSDMMIKFKEKYNVSPPFYEYDPLIDEYIYYLLKVGVDDVADNVKSYISRYKDYSVDEKVITVIDGAFKKYGEEGINKESAEKILIDFLDNSSLASINKSRISNIPEKLLLKSKSYRAKKLEGDLGL